LSEKENKALVCRLIEEMNKGNAATMAAIDELYWAIERLDRELQGGSQREKDADS